MSKIERLLFEEFDENIKGADIYNNDGSMWIIFTERRKWVVEFTKTGTLWYNYRHFTDILIFFGMGLDEGTEYIKKWYEERFLFKPKIVDNKINDRIFFVEDTIDNGVKHTERSRLERQDKVEYTIQNGVKNSQSFDGESLKLVEDAIQNGVKNTQWGYLRDPWVIENTIQNGVKNIYGNKHYTALGVENTIQNGVKHTEWNGSDLPTHKVEDAIQNGVKHTEDGDWLDGDERFEDIIQNGVKTAKGFDMDDEEVVEYLIQNGVKHTSSRGPFSDGTVEDAIKYGVKHIDYSILGSIYQKDHNVTTLDFTSKLENTIKNGVKEILSVDCEYPRATENVIKNGVKLKN